MRRQCVIGQAFIGHPLGKIVRLEVQPDAKESGMAKFRVWLEQSVSCPVIVEADNENEASERARWLDPDSLSWNLVEYHVFEIEKVADEPG